MPPIPDPFTRCRSCGAALPAGNKTPLCAACTVAEALRGAGPPSMEFSLASLGAAQPVPASPPVAGPPVAKPPPAAVPPAPIPPVPPIPPIPPVPAPHAAKAVSDVVATTVMAPDDMGMVAPAGPVRRPPTAPSRPGANSSAVAPAFAPDPDATIAFPATRPGSSGLMRPPASSVSDATSDAAADAPDAPGDAPAPSEAAGGAADADPMIGRDIDGYVIESVLNRAPPGTLFLARETAAGRRVTLRMVPVADPDERFRFLQEAGRADVLKHPNLAVVHGCGEADGHVYVAGEFAGGRTLADRVAAGPIDPLEAAAVVALLAGGLAHAHELGVPHRDIRPDAIWIGEDRAPKLGDFGLAGSLEDLRSLSGSGFSGRQLQFLAPEVCRGGPADAAADIWSLGAVLFHLLTGRMPFPDGGPDEVLAAKASPLLDVRSARPDVPFEIAAVLMWATTDDPARRCGSAAEFGERLRAAIQAVRAKAAAPSAVRKPAAAGPAAASRPPVPPAPGSASRPEARPAPPAPSPAAPSPAAPSPAAPSPAAPVRPAPPRPAAAPARPGSSGVRPSGAPAPASAGPRLKAAPAPAPTPAPAPAPLPSDGSPPTAEQMVGRMMGNYRLMTELGRGAMGVVYKAEDTNLGRLVAVKYLFSDKGAARERFRREARLEGMLSHPNIVPVYHYGEYDGVPFIVTELMTGGSLADLVHKKKQVPWRQAVTLARDIARALYAAHSKGIVHRDIKPANLLLDADGTVKIADFGLARETEDPLKLTKTGYVVGTAAFVSPELCKGSPASAASDLYAVGCTLYYMLTGKLPFDAPSVAQIIKMHLFTPFPDPRALVADVPEGITDILRRACAKEPHDRHETVMEFAEELDAVLNGEFTGGGRSGLRTPGAGMPGAPEQDWADKGQPAPAAFTGESGPVSEELGNFVSQHLAGTAGGRSGTRHAPVPGTYGEQPYQTYPGQTYPGQTYPGQQYPGYPGQPARYAPGSRAAGDSAASTLPWIIGGALVGALTVIFVLLILT